MLRPHLSVEQSVHIILDCQCLWKDPKIYVLISLPVVPMWTQMLGVDAQRFSEASGKTMGHRLGDRLAIGAVLKQYAGTMQGHET